MKPHMVTIIKVGGAVLEDPASLDIFIRGFLSIEEPKVLVHGGGRSATALAKNLNIPSVMVEGRRITDTAMLDIVTMVYAGLINKKLVANLQGKGINALGMAGCDLNVIKSRKRPPVNGVDFGFVGDIETVNSDILLSLIRQGITPIIAPLTHNCEGQLLNTNADSIASAVAIALSDSVDTTLIYCFEKEGVLSNPEDDISVIAEITAGNYEKLKASGTVTGGMIPKIENALAAVSKGVGKIIIKKYSSLGNSKSGTVIHN